ncbi:precorrin-6y C5,15-methyltransferase (decarboxylating), CbiE subunit [Methanocaldococcus infernus ME]|uniref:Precorrin-6y C5,15-methyltransferase (Decarboxylating), CbiE subunit n=1 Tax=Methanocaldococcus infernus (strain DSM 11812 / JCM 15783 / ME) TaxID=573063 RepID=D5VSY7_METIM|nr:cobalt-precorrin-7 (C(5))-methyltransferase [Methanocaldococcus infernus]ADG13690.1 precorrin-6y C5,15-methyltransferase (decarboxylating), CbiE subunit [Methanocaldococcus infernus ME]
MIYLIGIGPGDKRFLTLLALEKVNSCKYIVGSRRALSLFELKDKEVYEVRNVVEDLKNILGSIDYKAHDMAILSTGDPCFSGLLKTLLKIGVDKEYIEVIPGISSVQIASAKLKISWEDFKILTLHGKRENLKKLIDYIKNNEKVIFLPNNLKEDAKYLVENGIDREVWILENLTYPNEKIYKLKLSDCINKEFSYLTICVLD